MARMSPGSSNSSFAGPALDGWFAAHENSQRKTAEMKKSELAEFISFLWPAGIHYASPLNPVFLGESIRNSQQPSIFLARDGLVPLLWFFKNNPVPREKMWQFWVHKDLSAFVPNAWRKITGTYELVSLTDHEKKTKPSSNRKILLGGLVMDTYCSLQHLDQQLDWIESRFSRAELLKSEILLFLPTRLSGWGHEHSHDFFGNYMIKICKRLGTHVRTINWRTLEATPSLKGFDWMEFNENLLCADSYLSHCVLKREARLLKPAFNSVKEKAPGTKIINLSPYHGMAITSGLAGNCVLEEPSQEGKEFREIKAQFEKVMQSEANNRFPWPTWFSSWVSGVRTLKSTE